MLSVKHVSRAMLPFKGKVSYKCGKCDRNYKSKYHVKIHEQDHDDQANGVVFKCKICRRILKSRRTLHLHMKRVHLNKKPVRIWPLAPIRPGQVSCYFCGKFMSPQNLDNHLRRLHLQEKPFQCHMCPKRFSYHNRLFHHIRKLHPDIRVDTNKRYFHCSICPKQFRAVGHLNLHLTKGHKISPHIVSTMISWRCPLCEKSLPSKRQMEEHILELHGESTFPCTAQGCGSRFLTRRLLKNHESKYHDMSKLFTYCDICKIGIKGIFRFHQRLVHNQKQIFACNLCSKTFSTNEYLNRHVRLHTGEKPYMCAVCPSAFSDPDIYRFHVRLHKEDRIKTNGDITCLNCPRVYSVSNIKAAVSHERICNRRCIVASGNGQALCYFCGWRTSASIKTKMYNHMTSHLKERGFKCSACGQRFNKMSAWEGHVRLCF